MDNFVLVVIITISAHLNPLDPQGLNRKASMALLSAAPINLAVPHKQVLLLPRNVTWSLVFSRMVLGKINLLRSIVEYLHETTQIRHLVNYCDVDGLQHQCRQFSPHVSPIAKQLTCSIRTEEKSGKGLTRIVSACIADLRVRYPLKFAERVF